MKVLEPETKYQIKQTEGILVFSRLLKIRYFKFDIHVLSNQNEVLDLAELLSKKFKSRLRYLNLKTFKYSYILTREKRLSTCRIYDLQSYRVTR